MVYARGPRGGLPELSPPPPTSCSSAARGRATATMTTAMLTGTATRPFPLTISQAVGRDGPRIAAPQATAIPQRTPGSAMTCEMTPEATLMTEALTEVCVRPRQSLWRLPVPQPATHVRGDHTYTDVREGRRKQTNEQRLRLPGQVLESADLACVCCG